MIFRPPLLLALAPMLLVSCAVGPNYKPASPSALQVPEAYREADRGAAADLSHWWTNFNDPILSDLVARALKANPDIDVAGARLRQARALLRQSQASLLPSLSATNSGSRSETVRGPGGGASNFSAGFDASYEVDLFGGNRRSLQAAVADAQSSLASLHNVQLSIASEVALNYVQLRSAQSRVAIARANLAYQDETVQIVGWRVQAGLVSSLDLEQARTQRAQTAASIPSLETNATAAANRLAVLIGEAPGAVQLIVDAARSIPAAPDVVGAGLPAALLSRRPDLVSAERGLAAATARIGVSEAKLYPALRLSGSLTGSGATLGDVTDSIIGSLVSSVTAPIFQGGAIRAQIENARGGADVALGTYRSAVLGALEEVDNALTGLSNTRDRQARLAEAVDAARAARLYAQSQYRAGLIDFQKLLDAERSLLSAEDSLALSRGDRATAAIQLYKALGGGWENAPMPATAHITTARP